MATPIGGVHRCPACGATVAERRTPRGLRQRLRAALTGRRPYRCLRCRRRFYDRPAGPAGTPLAATAAEEAAGEARRETHWHVDVRGSGLRPMDIYLTALVVLVVAVVATTLLLLLWPDAVSVVQRDH